MQPTERPSYPYFYQEHNYHHQQPTKKPLSKDPNKYLAVIPYKDVYKLFSTLNKYTEPTKVKKKKTTKKPITTTTMKTTRKTTKKKPEKKTTKKKKKKKIKHRTKVEVRMREYLHPLKVEPLLDLYRSDLTLTAYFLNNT